MSRTHLLVPAFALGALCLSVGCSNPADNTPRAAVSDPIPAADPYAAAAPAATASVSAPASAPTTVPAPAPASMPTSMPTADRMVYPEELPPIAPKLYVSGPESSIGFVGSKITRSHEGGFNTFAAEVWVVDGNPEDSTVSITIDTTSLWTDTEKLTGHLKSSDFFDVATYPVATFKSTTVKRDGEGYAISGNLTLHGMTKGITFPATIDVTDEGVTARAEFHVMRFEFGMTYPGKADDLIRDEVVIKLDIVATPA